MPKVGYFRKRINPSLELLKPSLASKVPETPYLRHSDDIQLNSYLSYMFRIFFLVLISAANLIITGVKNGKTDFANKDM